MKSDALPLATITVEVVAAWPEQVLRQQLTVSQGTSIHDLKSDARLEPKLLAAWTRAKSVGVFGEPKPPREPLADGDRVELWRDLLADPKEARRERAKAARTVKQAIKPAKP